MELLCGNRLAPDACVDSIKHLQALHIRHIARGRRIAEILDLAVLAGKRAPSWEAPAIRIAGPREIDPVAGYFLGQIPVGWTPAPWLLIEMVEDVPEFREVARAPTFVHRAHRERRLLFE